ncbi:hypothetical protein FRC20_003127 [Serendipita sp. 405]|nr:hypothetical protein FRC20_003127 [Serendipita sp. 405]
MARTARSEASKRRSLRQNVIKNLSEARLYYWEQAEQDSTQKVSIRAVAKQFNVNHCTLARSLKDEWVSIDQFNASKTKIPLTQEEEIVEWCCRVSEQNLPMSRELLHEYAEAVLHATKPGDKLGGSWIDRFLTRHEDKLSRKWTRPRDQVRAISATPEAINSYFNAYKSIVGEQGEKIPPHQQFAFDETGTMRGYNQPRRCIVGREVVRAVRNSGGSRELITYVPVISASGELVENLVIFPGKSLRKDWIRNNPYNFAAAPSAKGYMNNVLGVEFIKLFDKATQGIASEGPRLLHADGHGSHLSGEFLHYAIEHNIVVLGYPPHTTHLLQGLDVVLFSPLKNSYAKLAEDFHMANHQDVNKSDFLAIMGKAVEQSFSKENILMAWKKTGLRPVDPSVIGPELLAPSRVFSSEETFPVTPPSPIRNLVAGLHALSLGSDQLERPATPDFPQCRQTALPQTLIFPSERVDLPDPLNLLNDTSYAPPRSPSALSKTMTSQDPALRVMEVVTQSLESTRCSFLLSKDPILSLQELPEVERALFSYEVIDSILNLGPQPSLEQWNEIKSSISMLYD